MSTFPEQLQDALRDRFTIQHELGGGGMSRVFLAEERQLARQVVIKTLPPEAAEGLSAERFAREIGVAARLQAPHIVPVIAAGVAAGVPYYTMPFIAGDSLRTRLAGGPVAPGDALPILRDVATALEHAHAQGIVHRDIKPENILLSRRSALVADFGIAKALSASSTHDGRTALTGLGVALGTPGYLAPEQAAGDVVDHRADLYAWGVVAYELLSGAHPFARHASAQQLIAAHLAEAPAPLAERPGVPPAVSALVMQCLAKAPEDRPASAAALVQVLDGAPAGAPTPARGARRRRLGAGVAAAALVLAGAAGLAWRARGTGGDGGRTPAAFDGPDYRTVAVLPFENPGDEQDRYMADGLTDELALALSRLPGLRVAARSSSYAFRGRPVPVEEVGKALRVGVVIEGSVLRSGARLRVIARLTSTTTGLQLWSDRFESSASDVFEVQDAVTTSIVAQLAPSLGDGAATGATRATRGTSSEAAYDLYLKARYFTNQRSHDALQRAVALYGQATAADPAFAPAFAGLAEALALQGAFAVVNPDTAYARARAAARRALALDSTLADPHMSLGMIQLFYDLDFPAARASLDAALRAAPRNAQLHLYNAWYKLVAEGAPAAIEEAWVAQRLDPLSLIINARVAAMQRYGHRYDDAARQLQRTLELNPAFGVALDELARLQATRGQYEAAVATARRAIASGTDARGILGYALARAGRRVEAEALVAAQRREGMARYVPPSNLGYAYVGLGDVPQALAAFRAAFERRDHEMSNLKSEPLLDPLRALPEFEQLMRRLP